MSERNLKSQLVKLLQQHHLLSAKKLLEQLKTFGKTYNKTSVYRALEQLETEGVICKHFFDETEADFELREHHHAHLVCTECGTVEATECVYHQPATIGTFLVDHHHLTLMGTCERCQAKNQL